MATTVSEKEIGSVYRISSFLIDSAQSGFPPIKLGFFCPIRKLDAMSGTRSSKAFSATRKFKNVLKNKPRNNQTNKTNKRANKNQGRWQKLKINKTIIFTRTCLM